jgi:hypothetical protein
MNKINKLLGHSLIAFANQLLPFRTFAIGNHPESSTCTLDKPHYAVCASSLHGHTGWSSHCCAAENEAKAQADNHTAKYHQGE